MLFGPQVELEAMQTGHLGDRAVLLRRFELIKRNHPGIGGLALTFIDTTSLLNVSFDLHSGRAVVQRDLRWDGSHQLLENDASARSIIKSADEVLLGKDKEGFSVISREAGMLGIYTPYENQQDINMGEHTVVLDHARAILGAEPTVMSPEEVIQLARSFDEVRRNAML